MIRHRSLERRLSLCLNAILALPVGATASTFDQVVPQTSTTGQLVNPAEPASLAESGAGSIQPAPAISIASIEQSQAPAQSPQAPMPAPTPLGAAAAPDTRIEGVAASTASGAAIAPAKQRRVRKFSIRTALIVGAVVAVGVVAGASLASPSHP